MDTDALYYLRITETDGKTSWSIKLSLAQKYETSKRIANIHESPRPSSSNEVKRYPSNGEKPHDLSFFKKEYK